MEPSCHDSTEISILYVEDEQGARDILNSILAKKYPGVRLHLADNGESGLELFTKHRPDIVITDINMPRMDGIRMASEIKSLTPETIVIALTAHSDTKFLLSAIEIGINHYVLKPLDYNRLFLVIDKCIALTMLERRIKSQSDHIRKLSRAVEQSPSSVVITDALGSIEYVNPRFTEITGYTTEEIRGQNPRILKSGKTPPEKYSELWRTITSGNNWHGEFLNRKKSGELYWESVSISPIHNEEGVITHYVSVKEDISDRKQAEQKIESLNIMLAARAQELEVANEELEAFNFTVSHDLRSPITSIHGFSQVLLEKCVDCFDEQCLNYVNIIHKEIRRMDAMVKALLKFSRLSRQEMDHEDVNLGAIAATIAMELQLRNPERRVRFTIAEEAHCTGDPALLRVVLENLIGNAWKYTSRKAETHIEFGVLNSGGKPTYFVRDNGAGFDAGQADKLFGVFKRLHSEEEFEGFGIGLATVQRIVQRHGGLIRAEGEVGKGATFYFTLAGDSTPPGSVAIP